MMGDGVIDLKGIRAAIEAAGFSGPREVEIFSAETWWKRPGAEMPSTCIDRIAKLARASKRLFYSYVGNKDALFLATLEATYGELRAAEQQLDLDSLPTFGALVQERLHQPPIDPMLCEMPGPVPSGKHWGKPIWHACADVARSADSAAAHRAAAWQTSPPRAGIRA